MAMDLLPAGLWWYPPFPASALPTDACSAGRRRIYLAGAPPLGAVRHILVLPD
jgi:hypothetical protein